MPSTVMMTPFVLPNLLDRNANPAQEYELAEEEVSISLDRFRDEYCNPDGSIK